MSNQPTEKHGFEPHSMDADFCAAQVPHTGGTHTCSQARSAKVHQPSAVQAPEQATPRLDLDAIRKRCEAATPGPWEWSGPTRNETARGLYRTYVHQVPGCGGDNIPPEKFYISIQSVGTAERDDADANFIANARTDIPALLDAYEAQAVRIQELEDALRKCDEYFTEYLSQVPDYTLRQHLRKEADNAVRAALKPKSEESQ